MMKVRKNFVSNSSSTNFIVCLDGDVKVEDYREFLMGKMGYLADDMFWTPPKGGSFDPTIDEVVDALSDLQYGGIVDCPDMSGSICDYLEEMFGGSLGLKKQGDEPLGDKLIWSYQKSSGTGYMFNACAPAHKKAIKRFFSEMK